MSNESEFSAAMEVNRIGEQARLCESLGRPLTDIEKLIFDRGHVSGVQFGIRNSARAFDRIVAGK